MTEDRRRDMVKQVHGRTEQGPRRHPQRPPRRDGRAQSPGEKEITADDLRGHETSIQKLTDRYVEQADELGRKKDAELLTV